MFENIKNGWKIGKAVRKIVSRDKSLMLYPIVAVVISIIAFLLIFGIGLFSAFVISGGNIHNSMHGAGSMIFIITIFISYIAIEFISVYVNIALLIAFKSFINGKKLKMMDAFGKAVHYRKNILEWAIFYSIIIMLLNIIESRFRGLGRLVIGFIGSLAITAATFFVVPVILEKNIGPIGAIKESVNTIYHKFGQTFGGVAYIDLYSFIFVIAGILIILGSILFLIPVLAVFIIFFIIGIIFLIYGIVYGATLREVFRLIVYDYANGKALPKEIDVKTLNSAIKKNKNKTINNI